MLTNEGDKRFLVSKVNHFKNGINYLHVCGAFWESCWFRIYFVKDLHSFVNYGIFCELCDWMWFEIDCAQVVSFLTKCSLFRWKPIKVVIDEFVEKMPTVSSTKYNLGFTPHQLLWVFKIIQDACYKNPFNNVVM